MPVVELDTIKASDAFGSGSSPDGHTKKFDNHRQKVVEFFIQARRAWYVIAPQVRM